MPIKQIDPVVIAGGILTLIAALSWNQVGGEIVKITMPTEKTPTTQLKAYIVYALCVSIVVMLLLMAHNMTCEYFGIREPPKIVHQCQGDACIIDAAHSAV
jgi:hypothetical protein